MNQEEPKTSENAPAAEESTAPLSQTTPSSKTSTSEDKPTESDLSLNPSPSPGEGGQIAQEPQPPFSPTPISNFRAAMLEGKKSSEPIYRPINGHATIG